MIRSSLLAGAALIAAFHLSDASGQDTAPGESETAARTRALMRTIAEARREDRLAACSALPPLWPESARAVPALAEMADRDEAAEVREAARTALREMGKRGSADYLARLDDLKLGERREMAEQCSLLFNMGANVTPIHILSPASYGTRSGLLFVPFTECVYADAPDLAAGIVHVLDSPDVRHRGFAHAALAAAAAVCAARSAAVPEDSSWRPIADQMLHSTAADYRLIGTAIHARIVEADEKALRRMLRSAHEFGVRSSSLTVAAAVRAAPVSRPVRDALVTETIGQHELLAAHRRALGFGVELLDAWDAGPGDEAAAARARSLSKALRAGNAALDAALARVSSSTDLGERGFWEAVAAAVTTPEASDAADNWLRPMRLAAQIIADPSDREAAPRLRELLCRTTSVEWGAWSAVRHLGWDATGASIEEIAGWMGRPDETVATLGATARLGTRAAPLIEPLRRSLAQTRELREKTRADSYGDLSRTFRSEIALVAHMRVFAAIGPSAAPALPDIRRFVDDPFLLLDHAARTAIRRIEAK